MTTKVEIPEEAAAWLKLINENATMNWMRSIGFQQHNGKELAFDLIDAYGEFQGRVTVDGGDFARIIPKRYALTVPAVTKGDVYRLLLALGAEVSAVQAERKEGNTNG